MILSDREGFLLINNVKHWYRIEGCHNKTVPIVIIHGGPGGNQYILERTIGPKLSQKFTVIYYEQRGSGRSDKPKDPQDYSIPILVEDLEGLRKELKVEKMYILGTSFGSWIAMEYALAYSDRIEKLILQGPVDGNWQRISINQIWGLYNSSNEKVKKDIVNILSSKETIDEKKNKIWDIVDEDTIARFSVHKQIMVTEAIRIMKESSKYGFNMDFHNAITKSHLTYPTLLDKISNLKIPTKIIVGLYDRNTGVEMSRDIAERIPDCKLVILKNSAHYPESEELDNYAMEITEFLKSSRSCI